MWTDALLEWVAHQCHATRVELITTGVVNDAMVSDEASFDGDPCRAHPVLRVHTGDRTLTVRPTLALWVEAPVASSPAAPGEVVAWTLAPARLDLAGGPIVHPGEWIATDTIAAGEVLTQLRVTARPDAVAGATVALSVRAGALEIRSEGRLLRDARVGETARVYVAATRTVVTGLLLDPTTVVVR